MTADGDQSRADRLRRKSLMEPSECCVVFERGDTRPCAECSINIEDEKEAILLGRLRAAHGCTTPARSRSSI